MYRHCIFCAGSLGSNEAIEEFPVGRRLAFDGEKGRLWVVCRTCERWNLSPIETRWEAIEAAERRFRDTRARVSTANIGLARLDEGTELVRIGRPQRPEFAAWRYGDQFGRRRRKFIVGAGVGAVAIGAGAWGFAAVAGATAILGPLQVLNYVHLVRSMKSVRLHLRDEDGVLIPVPQQALGTQKVRPSPDHPGGWYLDLGDVKVEEGRRVLSGTAAVEALGVILPKLNVAGAGKGKVREAVGYIEEVGGPAGLFPAVEMEARRRGYGYNPLRGLPHDLRLALEMAANEQHERAALEGELERLERAWREAEELAAIADDLTIPDGIRGTLARLKQSVSRQEAS